MNGVPLLAVPFTLTTIFPEVAPLGTGTVMLVADQFIGVATVPLKVTVLLPCGDPKLTPVSVTVAPTGPADGEMELMVGVVETVNGIPLLDVPFTVTTTLPDVAPSGTGTERLDAVQFVGDPAVPLNVTVLPPCVVPKLVPVMVTDTSGSAVFGRTLSIRGAGT